MLWFDVSLYLARGTVFKEAADEEKRGRRTLLRDLDVKSAFTEERVENRWTNRSNSVTMSKCLL